MRILVMSDSHEDTHFLCMALDAQPSAKTVLFLGDGVRDLELVMPRYPGKDFYYVKGNGDFGVPAPWDGTLSAEGISVFYTHGHNYHVKLNMQELMDASRARKADVVLYGHTHEPHTAYENGLYIMNPGTVSGYRTGNPTYGILDLTPSGIVATIVHLRIF